jgi:uracil-DNA glycosylase family 4
MSPALDNVTGCHPPDNKLKNYPDAIDTCTSLYLSVTLSVVRPKVVVTMGALAGQTWFPGMKAMEMQQMARAVVMDGRTYVICGCLHPAYVARGTDPGAYGLMMASLQRAAQLMKEV